MDARDPGDLTGRLRHAVELVDGHAEVDDAHEDHQEDDDHEGELDERLTTMVASAVHGAGTVFVIVTLQLPLVAVTATGCDPLARKFTVGLAPVTGPEPLNAPVQVKVQPVDEGVSVAVRSIRCGLPGFDRSLQVKSIVGHDGGGVAVGPEPVTVTVPLEELV